MADIWIYYTVRCGDSVVIDDGAVRYGRLKDWDTLPIMERAERLLLRDLDDKYNITSQCLAGAPSVQRGEEGHIHAVVFINPRMKAKKTQAT